MNKIKIDIDYKPQTHIAVWFYFRGRNLVYNPITQDIKMQPDITSVWEWKEDE